MKITIPKKIPVLFSRPKKIPASFIDPKKSLLAKLSDPKKSLGPPPPFIKIFEWGPWEADINHDGFAQIRYLSFRACAKKGSKFSTITAHFLRACSQIYHALLILMAYWSASSRLRFHADNFSASFVYHQRNRLLLGDLTQHLNNFLLTFPKKENFTIFKTL